MFHLLTNRHLGHFVPGFVGLYRVLLIAALAMSLLMLSIPSASAKGSSFGGGRSFSSSSFSSSRSYSTFRSTPTPAYRPAPAPAPVVVNKTVVNRTTVVQSAPAASSGGGFFSTFAGSMAGSAIGQWLFAPKPSPVAPPPVDCTQEANKALPACQPKQ